MYEHKWLIEIRQKRKLTQEQVAELVGIKRPYYTMIENGTRRPSVEVAQKIGSVLKFKWTLFFKQEGSGTLLNGNDEQAATCESLQHLSVAYTV